MNFDTDKACQRNARMWRRVGLLLEKSAVTSAEIGNWRSAVDLARAADACFWQATGEGDAIGLKELRATS